MKGSKRALLLIASIACLDLPLCRSVTGVGPPYECRQRLRPEGYFDYMAADLPPDTPYDDETVDSCTARCLATPSCGGFVMQLQDPSSSTPSRCWLKNDNIGTDDTLWREDNDTHSEAYSVVPCLAKPPSQQPPPPLLPPPFLRPQSPLLPPPAPPPDSDESISTAVIAGVAAAGVIVLLAVCCLFIWCFWKKRPTPHEKAKVAFNSEPGVADVPKGMALFDNTFESPSELAAKKQALEAAIASGENRVEAALDFLLLHLGGSVDATYVLNPDEPRVSGGQATVAMAAGKLGGAFAIKFFADHATFLQEAEVYKLLIHADPFGSAFIHDMRSNDGRALAPGLDMPSYIVMKRGMSMQDWVRNRRPPPLMGVWMLGEVAWQLSLLHAQGLVHRDLKPGNILWLSDDHAWRVIDFGCTVRSGTVVSPAFTPRYAPPEALCAGKNSIIAHESMDIYALGVMAFEMMTGELLFPLGTSTTDMRRALERVRRFPHEDNDAVWRKAGRLRGLVQEMLARDPAARPPIAVVVKRLEQLAVVTGATTLAPAGPAGCSRQLEVLTDPTAGTTHSREQQYTLTDEQ